MSLRISIHTTDDALRQSAIHQVVTALATKITDIRQSGLLPQEAGLSIEFLLPDAQPAIPFNGIRINSYDDKTAMLGFQVAVPPHVIESSQAAHFAATAVLDAIDHALLYFRETYETNGIRFKSSRWHSALVPLFRISPMRPGGMAHA